MRQLPPPKSFSADEREVWTVAQKQLRQQGTWTGRSDVPLLEAYCKNVVLARTLRAAVGADQLQALGQGGAMLAAAKLKAAGDAEAAAFRYATALILTPEARKRHGIRAGGETADELAALVA